MDAAKKMKADNVLTEDGQKDHEAEVQEAELHEASAPVSRAQRRPSKAGPWTVVET